MHLIFSDSSPSRGPLSDDDLVDLYRHSPADRPGRVRMRTNFVSTLDGSIVGPDGRSGSINTPSDHRVFALHRALSDVIMVGAGTVRAEGYRAVDLADWQREIRAAEGLSAFPLLLIISGSGNVNPSVARPVSGPGGPVVIITSATATGPLAALRAAGVEVIEQPGREIDLVSATTLLAERGLTRVMCEGGPRLHRDLLAADLVDELSLTLAPTVVGGDGSRTTAGSMIPEPRRFLLHHAIYDDEDATLLTHYRRTSG